MSDISNAKNAPQHITFEDAKEALDQTRYAQKEGLGPNWDIRDNDLAGSGPTRGHAWLGHRVHATSATGSQRWGAAFLRSFTLKGRPRKPGASSTPYARTWSEVPKGGWRRGRATAKKGWADARDSDKSVARRAWGGAKLAAGSVRMLGNVVPIEQSLKGSVLLGGLGIRLGLSVVTGVGYLGDLTLGNLWRTARGNSNLTKLDKETWARWDPQTYANKLADKLDSKDKAAERRRGALRDCALAIAAEYPCGEKAEAVLELHESSGITDGILGKNITEKIMECLEADDPRGLQDPLGKKLEIETTVLRQHGLDLGSLTEAIDEAAHGHIITVRQGKAGFGVEAVTPEFHPDIVPRGCKFVRAAFRAKYGDEALGAARMPGGSTVLDFLQSADRFTVVNVRQMRSAMEPAGGGIAAATDPATA
jgi:hypothetical protein